MNRGRGIELYAKMKDIQMYFGEKQVNSQYVVQKYIEKPLLYKGRKFDIRIWGLVTAKEQRLFLFKQGYMRTSSHGYDLENKENINIHLTNNCLQVNDSSYGQHEQGNTLSLDHLASYVQALVQEDPRLTVF